MKRYNLQEDFGHNLMEFEEPDGEWVKWADAKAETDTLMEQLRAAWEDQKKLERVREWASESIPEEYWSFWLRDHLRKFRIILDKP